MEKSLRDALSGCILSLAQMMPSFCAFPDVHDVPFFSMTGVQRAKPQISQEAILYIFESSYIFLMSFKH